MGSGSEFWRPVSTTARTLTSLLTCYYTEEKCATNATLLFFDVCALTCSFGSAATFESLTGLRFVREEAGSKSRPLPQAVPEPFLVRTEGSQWPQPERQRTDNDTGFSKENEALMSRNGSKRSLCAINADDETKIVLIYLVCSVLLWQREACWLN